MGTIAAYYAAIVPILCSCLNVQCISLPVKARFHYAIWFEAGSKLVAHRFVRTSFETVCDQLRTCFEPASNQIA